MVPTGPTRACSWRGKGGSPRFFVIFFYTDGDLYFSYYVHTSNEKEYTFLYKFSLFFLNMYDSLTNMICVVLLTFRSFILYNHWLTAITGVANKLRHYFYILIISIPNITKLKKEQVQFLACL